MGQLAAKLVDLRVPRVAPIAACCEQPLCLRVQRRGARPRAQPGQSLGSSVGSDEFVERSQRHVEAEPNDVGQETIGWSEASY
jgi:hypothetical protein